MDRIEINTSQNVRLDLPIAGLGDRLVAAVIDYLMIGMYACIVIMYAGITQNLAATAVFSLPIVLYFLLCEVFMDGQSIGKRYMNIKVARRDGTAASLGNYLVRWLLRPIDFTLTSGAGAMLSILITGTGQRIGDLAAGTTVVKVEERQSVQDLPYAQEAPDHTPQFPEVDTLTEDEVRTAHDVLKALRTNRAWAERRNLGTRTKRALERKMNLESSLEPKAFLEAVVNDYAILHRAEEPTGA